MEIDWQTYSYDLIIDINTTDVFTITAPISELLPTLVLEERGNNESACLFRSAHLDARCNELTPCKVIMWQTFVSITHTIKKTFNDVAVITRQKFSL